MSGSSGELKRAKRALRRDVLERRDALAPEERGRRSRAIAERVAALPELAGAMLLLLYWPMGSEVDPRPILDLLPTGLSFALPRVVGSDVVPVAYAPGDPLASSRLGPQEPVLGVGLAPVSIDAVIVPGVAFDRRGERLGYGGGFYDRFAARLRPGAPRIGLAFALQIAPEVPTGGSDVGVDVVVTEDEVIRP